ncbi:hypothetical protein N0V94_005524 [Neodidymelliopsis sp. IMI 364377]|nr:hypothetical protein N0V94_005524 [Neodidymelliopsis sp. IMI 364377]
MAQYLPAFYPAIMPYRAPVKEYSREHRAWIQNGRKFRNIKSSKAFIWPKDGRNGSKWGRMKDILQDKGPDIHVAISADKMDYMTNRQRRSRWSGWTCLDDRNPDLALSSKKYAPWTNNAALGGRAPGLSYDFRTRKYVKADEGTWTDASWQQEPNAQHTYPEAVRNFYGGWFQDRNYDPRPYVCSYW